jgi:sugar/nucleoside kinase (ribokinase family)
MTSQQFDILTIADACVDLVVNLGDTLPRFGQEEQWVQDYFLELGGSACIFACQAAKLGLRVGILGRVGADELGEFVLRRLQACGVDTQFMLVEPTVKTGLGIHLLRAQGDRAILTVAGSLNAVYEQDISDAWLQRGRHLHYCSYFLQTHLAPHAPNILRRARSLGLSVSLDTNWDPGNAWESSVTESVRAANIFFPNEQEAMAIARAPNVGEALDRLTALTPLVALKSGAQGALVGRGAERWEVPVLPATTVVDSIGAGDSFAAGFVVAWLAGASPLECAQLGNACARETVTQPCGILGQPRAADLAPLWRWA